MAPRTRTTSLPEDAASTDPITRIDDELGTLRGHVLQLCTQVGELASEIDRRDILDDGIDDFEPVPPPTAAQARDPFGGPVVPLLMGAMLVAGVAGAVVDGVGMAARTIRRL